MTDINVTIADPEDINVSLGTDDISVTIDGVTTLVALSDTNITSPQDADHLVYSSSSGKWENNPSSAAVSWGGITGTLSNQTDLQVELDLKANITNVLVLDNTTPFTPDADYEPATKKYVDDNTGGSTSWGAIIGTLSNQTDLQTALDAKEEDLTFSTGLTRSTNTITTNDSQIVHQSISGAGTNTHPQIDTHIANVTTNPHALTATNINLGNVSNVATSDTAYNATSWNTNLDSATKNAIRDKVETMDTAIGLNTSKVTNATHTGDVTGSGALTIGVDKVNDTHIDFGTGANQVSTADLPEQTNLYYTEARVNANTNVSANTTHRSSNGSDHSFINQDVTTTGTPTFGITTLADSSQLATSAAPTVDADIANKKYVDDNSGGAPEGTAVKSTGEIGGNKFLREDGDGTSSWQLPAGGGDVSKVGTPVDNQVGVWTGDGTIEGTAGLTYNGTALDLTGNITLTGTVDGIDIATDVAANTSKQTNVSTNLSDGTRTATTVDVNSSDGTNATLVEADTTNAGILGSNKWDEIVASTTHISDTAAHGATGAVVGTTNTQTLSNKKLVDLNTTFVDNLDNTKTAAFELVNITTSTDRILTLQDKNITIADNADLTSHTGTSTIHFTQGAISIPASQVSDFDVEVANNSAVTANTAKDTNVSTNLSEGTNTVTTVDVNSSDGTNATLVSASTSRAGLLTKAKWDEIVANTAKATNVSTNLSAGTRTSTTYDVNSSDGTNATLVEADTTNAGILGSDKWDEIVANTLKVSYSKTNVKATINHGSTAGTARPTGFASVEWIGTVEPTNSTNDDTWIDTT